MVRNFPLVAVIAAISIGCASVSDDEPSLSEALVGSASKVEVVTTWSCGENGEERGTLSPNEDGEYSSTNVVVLGPAIACLQPVADRPAGTTCSWSAPSRCWRIKLSIEASTGGDPMLVVDGYAGDSDSSFRGKLPVALVPRVTPWEIDVSPDNASDAWGSARVAVRRAP
jgi:hypothetical protein